MKAFFRYAILVIFFSKSSYADLIKSKLSNVGNININTYLKSNDPQSCDFIKYEYDINFLLLFFLSLFSGAHILYVQYGKPSHYEISPHEQVEVKLTSTHDILNAPAYLLIRVHSRYDPVLLSYKKHRQYGQYKEGTDIGLINLVKVT